MSTVAERVYHVVGRVIDRTSRRGQAGLRIEVLDRNADREDVLGTVVTDRQGAFRIELDRSSGGRRTARRPAVFFKVHRGDQLIRSTDDTSLSGRNGETTRVTIEVEAPAPPARRPVPFAVGGRLINAANGYPLVGLRVGAYFVEPPPGDGREPPAPNRPAHLLGEGISGPDGRFRVAFADTPLARQQLCLLRDCAEAFFVLSVEGADGAAYLVTDPLRGPHGARDLRLSVPLPARPIDAETWHAVGTAMEEARVVQLHALARQLTASPAESMFPDLDLEMRHSLLTELDQAFLDPTGALPAIGAPPTMHALGAAGALARYEDAIWEQLRSPAVEDAFFAMSGKLDSFADLYQVDWIVDTGGLKQGNTGQAVAKYQDAYTSPEAAPGPGQVEVPVAKPDMDLVNYRNYLRTIFTGPKGSPDYGKYRDRLETRFHQDFDTNSTVKLPANQRLVAILKAILTAPGGDQYGFNKAPASLPPQGDLTHREYLDQLIGLTNLSRAELGRRYRLDLERPDEALSSAVEENIFTLQRFYADGFQSKADPYPIIPDHLLGEAPFFLQYDEWLHLNGPFYGENYYLPRQTFKFTVWAERKESLRKVDWKQNDKPLLAWVVSLFDLEDKLNEAHLKLEQGQYAMARERYEEALQLATGAMVATFKPEDQDEVFASDIVELLADRLAELLALPMDHPSDLDETFMGLYQVGDFGDPDAWWAFLASVEADVPRMQLSLLHLYVYVLPACLGDLALATGDYAQASYYYGLATRFLLARASLGDDAGYPNHHLVHDFGAGDWYRRDGLPYTSWTTVGAATYGQYPQLLAEELADLLIPDQTHPMERKFFRLRHGNALLEWADALYRTDDPAAIARAREVYKAVLWLHGESPGLSPQWPVRTNGAKPTLSFHNHAENPAVTSQKARARRGLYQVEAGLNYYGCRDDMVPALRYRPLKDAADRLAAAAKAAEQDFLAATGKIEDAIREGIMTANMLKKAALQGQIAAEQAGIAKVGVQLAQHQVAQVQAAIKAKQDEIDDHDGFGEQLVDWVGGFKDAIVDLPDFVTEGVGEGAAHETGLKEMKAEGGFFGGGGWLGLGSQASLASGYGIFVYAGITSLVSLGEAQNQRVADLKTLKETVLPLAQAQLGARQREVTIANLYGQIALADADLALALIRFQATRLLNPEFWANVAAVMKRVMRRYLELGARYAWLAERALAYEQDRPINIIQFNYFPLKLQGVTGADLLALDLAELEASRLDRVRQSVPLKRTYSLAFDFPLQFGQLKKTGRCTFQTLEAPLRQAYPGTYAHRVRAVSVAIQTAAPRGPLVGLLTNSGVSSLSRADGSSHVSIRGAEAFPLSEFRLKDDLVVFGLPDEALLNFEGSGVETFWELELPAVANPYGRSHLADVLLTCDLRAQYSPELRQQHLAALPTSIRRFVLVSAKAYAAPGLADLQGEATSATVAFDVAAVGLPENETDRKLKNLVLILIAPSPLDVIAVFGSSAPALDVTVAFENGVALSNAPPIADDQSSAPPSPLNAFVDVEVAQTFNLAVLKTGNPGVDFSTVADVILGIEYEAGLTP